VRDKLSFGGGVEHGGGKVELVEARWGRRQGA
jgi:hypothetical protein